MDVLLVAALPVLSVLPGCDLPATSNNSSADTGADQEIVLGAHYLHYRPYRPGGRLHPRRLPVRRGHVNRAGGVRIGDKSYRLVLKYYDDQSSAKLVPDLYRKLLDEDHVDILLGPYSSALTMQAVPVAEAARVPIIDDTVQPRASSQTEITTLLGYLAPPATICAASSPWCTPRDPSAHTIALLGADEAFSHEVLEGASDYAQEVRNADRLQRVLPDQRAGPRQPVVGREGFAPRFALGFRAPAGTRCSSPVRWAIWA